MNAHIETATIACGLNDNIDPGYDLGNGKIVSRVVSRTTKLMRRPQVPCNSFAPYLYSVVAVELADEPAESREKKIACIKSFMSDMPIKSVASKFGVSVWRESKDKWKIGSELHDIESATAIIANR